ncbi:nuclear transport factor 2 family protein [Caulobacter segnis]|uniref:nuclear transport factor 2 family protein n=1 Tax=Caulobacter segnis TaxID=88688 RepID=UPI001CBF35E6|nr:nuclear transport factor 2 family protein [Caulobacter segnis]UAL11508.1 nuclear transport factor 2 family protein [Caulobacter segnis]
MHKTLAMLAAGAALLTTAPALAQASNPEEPAVRAALEHYLAGHATGDPKEFRQAFHDDSRLMWIRDNALMQRSDDEYIAGATGKPAADEAQRKRWIESISITGSAASAKIVLDYPTAVLTDYMQLLKTPDGWKIVHKIFDVAPKAKPAS